MKPIGGFFELELPGEGNPYHDQALGLSTGRSCLSMIIKYLNPGKCYLPFYTCDATVDPFIKTHTMYEFYPLKSNLDPLIYPELKKGEYLLYINYFGIKTNTVKQLANQYGNKLIIDNTHNFFDKGSSSNWSFTSARKYFGIPDGAYLYSPVQISEEIPRFTGISISHLLNRLLGFQDVSYQQFLEYEKNLTSEIYRISILSEKILNNLEYDKIIQSRIANFRFLHTSLKEYNTLQIDEDTGSVPFCYPFLSSGSINIEELHKKMVFVPRYWQDVINRKSKGFDFEKRFSSHLLPLPTDHRYGEQDMSFIIETLRSIL